MLVWEELQVPPAVAMVDYGDYGKVCTRIHRVTGDQSTGVGELSVSVLQSALHRYSHDILKNLITDHPILSVSKCLKYVQ